uniref:tRNA pseudouridine(55) synthase n=1 Tax=Denticeps clupeoides TaxID=299321 RepID=A0AAY4AAH1_9TELE
MEVHLLQEEINQSSDKIRVRDVQIVTREAVAHMKEGEEEKTKSYSALIWTQKSIVQNDIEFISDIKELKVAQKTPLRVLHRRPLAVRQRLIHTMSTRYLDPHHFYLHLRTQAGTYPPPCFFLSLRTVDTLTRRGPSPHKPKMQHIP